jgi:hypothetical protein
MGPHSRVWTKIFYGYDLYDTLWLGFGGWFLRVKVWSLHHDFLGLRFVYSFLGLGIKVHLFIAKVLKQIFWFQEPQLCDSNPKIACCAP